MLPPIGTYLRPVGACYAYCYQVLDVLQPCREWPRGHLTLRRWGMDQAGQPIKDGHQDQHYLGGLTQVTDGVWKDEWEFDTPRWSCCPLYYRRIDVGGQKALF